MRLLHIESPNSGQQGDHVYRTGQPCRALGTLPGCVVTSGSFLDPAVHAAIASADVLVLCDTVDPDLLAVIEARRAAGRLTVYEINDHVLAPQDFSATAYLAHNPLLRSLSLQMAARSHALQVNVPALRDEFGFLNPQTAVFENQLWDVPPPRKAPGLSASADAPVWVGWGGSLGHRDDLAWALPALRAALDRHPHLGLAVMGPEGLRALFGADSAVGKSFAGLSPARFRFVAGGSLARYYEFIASLDIGVCPLLPTDFNRCRSDVKFLELASRGVPALCSDLAPYAHSVVPEETGLRFSDLDQLGAQLDRLVRDPALRTRIGAAAYDHARSARQEREHAPRRLQQYRRWQAALSPSDARHVSGDAANSARADDGDIWNLRARDAEGSTYVALSGGPVETTLRGGLQHAVAGQIGEACAAFREARRLAPAFYLPALYLGTMDSDPQSALAALDVAAALAPLSSNVALQRGLRLSANGNREAARAAFLRCEALLPTLGAAAAHLGALAEAAGRTDEAMAHYERAFANNPYYVPPVLRLVQHAQDRGDRARATSLIERATQHDPKSSRLHFLMARSHADEGRWHAAQDHLGRALTSAAPHERAPALALLAKAQLARNDRAAAASTLAELRSLVAPPPAADATASFPRRTP